MAIKILSVDDELDLKELIQQKFRRKIRQKEYEFLFAHSGIQALDALKTNPDVDVVLSDINMPEMDGLTMLAKIKELQLPYIKAIMVSAYSDLDNIRVAMNRGAFDFVTKPINFEDLENTINKTGEAVQQLKNLIVESEKLKAFERELETAKKIQLSFIPKSFPNNPKIEIFGKMKAAKIVGGDLFDYFFINNNLLGFCIADVSGKGIPAALFMAVSRTVIRAAGMQAKSPTDCMQIANNQLALDSIDSMFLTAFYGIIDINSGELSYTNAGHNPPYIISANNELKIIEKTNDPILGFMDGIVFHRKTLHIKKGETIFAFTDGITEAMNINNEEYKEKRLEKILSSTAGKSLEEMVNMVISDVKQFTVNAEQSDDLTLLAIRLK